MTSSRTDSALVDVTMPQMGVSVAEGTVVGWRVEVGDRIGADQAICDISTDKIDTEVPAPVAGVVAEILVRGRTRRSTSGRCWRGSRPLAPGRRRDAPPAAAPRRPPQPRVVRLRTVRRNGAAGTPPAAGDLRRYSPVVQRIAAEHGIDLSQVEGTGRGGRVRKQDVLALVEDGGGAAAPASRSRRCTSRARTARTRFRRRAAAPAVRLLRRGSGQLSRMRRQIGEHMKRSLETAATCTTWIEVDMCRVEAARKRLGRDRRCAFVARAVIDALREHPALNATLEGERTRATRDVNLGHRGVARRGRPDRAR